MKDETRTFGDLSCRIVDAVPDGRAPKLLVILCHGFGAPGTDLVPLAAELLYLAPFLTSEVQFVFPAAPLSLDHMGLFGGRAWWPVDVGALAAAVERGQLRAMLDDAPAELLEARDLLTAAIGQLATETGLPIGRMVLGGFSQGSMLATDVALRLPETAAGLCVMSGTLKFERIWRAEARRHAGMRVLISHGRQDPIVPYQGAEWLWEMFREAGLAVEFLPFDGGHTIPPQILESLAGLLGDLAG
ncbi:MAG: phospholipase [Planctomycetales bacterium]|nr:phospholipase [Planctomycetales bacterium]NIM08486.1 phospholipase [Planctomycetales bacterium]NIN07963.1 phospholipase [Planctomycetales bacterium]NIN77091.1 phospholipase [Planctomycetales bacterium]NIO34269.1 phospholipase [Planctomycetales bacterium]